jgi:hypothetical protein
LLDISQAGVSLIIAFVANLVFKLFLVGIIGNAKMLRLTLMCFVCLTLPALIVFV